MSWFRFEASFRDSLKVTKFARILGVSKHEGRGILVTLWCWVCDHKPDGDLSGLDAADLAENAQWEGDPDLLFRALEDMVLIDVDDQGAALQIHGWKAMAEGYKRAEREAERRAAEKEKEAKKRKAAEERKSSKSQGEGTRGARVGHAWGTRGEFVPGPTDRPTDQTDQPTEREDSSELPPSASASEPPESFDPIELEIEPVEEQPDLIPPEPEPDEPVALTFPTAGKAREWAMRESHVTRLVELWPGLDVPAELRKALAWCEANKAKRKTANGMPAFLNAWLARAQNSGRANGRDSPAPTKEERVQQMRDALKADREKRNVWLAPRPKEAKYRATN